MPETELLEAERPEPGEGERDTEVYQWTTRRLETGENVLAREQSAHVQPPAIAGRVDGKRHHLLSDGPRRGKWVLGAKIGERRCVGILTGRASDVVFWRDSDVVTQCQTELGL